MTVSLICGFEQDITSENSGNQFGFNTPQNTVVHGGSFAERFNPVATLQTYRWRMRAAGGTNRALFRSCRFYLNIASLPASSNPLICSAGDTTGTNIFSLVLNNTGQLTVQESGGTSNTSTLALTADNLWHRIEFDVGWNAGAGARVFVDGVNWASFSTVTLAAQVQGTVGIFGVTATADIYIDDVIWDDSTLGGSVGYDWKCVLLKPISDPASLNSWTVAGGGTSNLWDSVNNIPPADVVTAGNCIVNAASGGNLDYTPTMQSYIDGGLGASDIVRSVIANCRDKEDTATSTKSGGVWIASNPAQSAGGLAFDYGDDASGFFGHIGGPTVNPTVTLATKPTLTVRKTTSTTRQVDVDFLGIYVEYTPVTVSAKPMKVAVLGL